MKIDCRTVGDVWILDCRGKLTLGEGTVALRNSVREILRNRGKRVILNLADVDYIDHCGVGELVSSYTSITGQGGKLELLNVTRKLHELLEITKLLTIFKIYNDEQSALLAISH